MYEEPGDFIRHNWKGIIVNKWVMYGLIFAAGVVFSGKVRTLPLFDKLPSF
jgi:hypothetical protein